MLKLEKWVKLTDRVRSVCNTVWHSASKGTWLRGLIFWPSMALAVVLLYTGWSPFAPSFSPERLKIDERLAEPSVPAPVPHETPLPAPASESALPRKEDASDPVAEALAALPAFRPENAVRPVLGPVVRNQGWYRHPEFGDWRLSPGAQLRPEKPYEPVRAAYAGVVSQVNKDTSGGSWTVTVIHKDGWSSEYRGLEEVIVVPHEAVSPGSELGRGSSDESALLTFVLRRGETFVDPVQYIP